MSALSGATRSTSALPARDDRVTGRQTLEQHFAEALRAHAAPRAGVLHAGTLIAKWLTRPVLPIGCESPCRD